MEVAKNGTYSRTNYASDARNIVPRFFTSSVEDHLASQQAGRPIFREEERVEIIMPGNPFTRPVHKVNEEHKKRWPEQYAAFKKGSEMAEEGTPLEEWPRLKRSQVLELKALNFTTVEQIAAMSDQAIQHIGLGGRGLRDMAIAYLDDAEANAMNEKLVAERDRNEAEIMSLRNQLTQVQTMMETMHGELQQLRNAPSPLLTAIPAQSDPMALSRAMQAPEPPAASSLDSIAPRRPGRPKKAA